MKKENLPTNELLKMIDSFEHYPAVTDEDDRAYILAYLDDEACSISEDEIEEYISSLDKFIIKDWAGNIMFNGKEFVSFDDGWAYIYEKIEDKDNAYDDVFVEKVASK